MSEIIKELVDDETIRFQLQEVAADMAYRNRRRSVYTIEGKSFKLTCTLELSFKEDYVNEK